MKALNWSAIHTKKKKNLLTFFLRGLSFLYSFAIQFRLAMYKTGFLRAKYLPVHVISIGNITTGGTGKTPFVAMIAQWAETHGLKVAILSRGYKGKRSNDLVVVSDGKTIFSSFDDAGDEPVMLARTLSSVPVLISKKRYQIGSLALKLFGSELLLLDDGYQHLSLYRDANILLVDAKRQFGNRSLLPLGPLREPIAQIKRASIIVITKCTDTHPGDKLVDYFQKNFPTKSIFRSRYYPHQVDFPLAGATYPPDILKGKNVVVFAGIAHPDDFLETVKDCGANIVHFQAFSDHHFFSAHEIEELASWKKYSNVDFLLTTEKDWIRIDGKIDPDLDIAILTIKIELLSGANTFFESIKQGIIRSNAKKSESQSQA
jgi:tetraacyldisaccharide 4'-kinase